MVGLNGCFFDNRLINTGDAQSKFYGWVDLLMSPSLIEIIIGFSQDSGSYAISRYNVSADNESAGVAQNTT